MRTLRRSSRLCDRSAFLRAVSASRFGQATPSPSCAILNTIKPPRFPPCTRTPSRRLSLSAVVTLRDSRRSSSTSPGAPCAPRRDTLSLGCRQAIRRGPQEGHDHAGKLSPFEVTGMRPIEPADFGELCALFPGSLPRGMERHHPTRSIAMCSSVPGPNRYRHRPRRSCAGSNCR